MATKKAPDKRIKGWEKDFKKFQGKLGNYPWILQGSVVEILPPPNSPRARPRYIWTRKVNQKTVTVSLSKQQYQAFIKAIDANRDLESTLRKMRDISQTVLLETLPGVQKRNRKKRSGRR